VHTQGDHHHSIRSVEELEKFLIAKGMSWDEAQLPKKEVFSENFPVRIPYYYADLINWKNPKDPLRLMVIPDEREKHPKDYELGDPIGDHAREAVPGLIHRYPDRCLLLLTSYCLVHCRFCFRREVVGKVRPVQFGRIAKYLETQPHVEEIIFSGGDPFTFPVGFLQTLTTQLSHLDHVQTWRFHTRVPAIDPESVTDQWIEQLAQLGKKFGKKVVIVTHINHPSEVTPQFEVLVRKLLSAECLVLSQTVMLKGANTDRETLMKLFRSLVHTGVKPYYLHHLDQVYGSHHFRISIEEGKKLFSSLRGQLSSICLPEYVLDLPGGKGKVPVMWFKEAKPKHYTITTFEGEEVLYIDHAGD
jgi:lysine 2,3-aminomutase